MELTIEMALSWVVAPCSLVQNAHNLQIMQLPQISKYISKVMIVFWDMTY